MVKVNTIILRGPGTNCDYETAYAFQQAGSETNQVHINRLISGETGLAGYQIMVIPGGFTYGDDIAAGKVLANELRLKLGEQVGKFIKNGGLILGICNGFQVLAKSGFLTGVDPESARGFNQTFTLTNNDSGRFECRWVYLKVNENSPCVFTRDIEQMYLPVAHGEGKVAAEPEIIPKLNAVLFYSDESGNPNPGYPANPNGSVNDIAGICDVTGRIFALMPHPERHVRRTQHPRWNRLGNSRSGDGLRIFQNAVQWVKSL